MKKSVLLCLLILLTTFANARKLYVSSSYTGTTSNGALATPWKSLANVTGLVTGDSVLFAKGDRFSGRLNLFNKTGLYFGVYGTGADPLFWGTGSQINGALVTLTTCTNITFYGWNISDTTISLIDRTVQAKIQYAFITQTGSNGITVRKCRMDRIGYGLYIPDFNNNNTVDSCDIGNLRMIRNTPEVSYCKVNAACSNPTYCAANPSICDSTTGVDDDYGGVPIQISSRNNTITNNYFHDCYSQSYDYGRDGGGIEFFEEGDTVKGNRIMYNTFYDCNGTFEFGSSSSGASSGVASFPQVDNIIAYNKIINNGTVVYINNRGQYKTEVKNLQFYNNVIIQTVPNPNLQGSSGVMFSMATNDVAAGIVVLKNNIIKVSNNGLPLTFNGQFNGVNLTHTNNIYKLSGGTQTNFTLDATERANTGITWTDTTSANPVEWNYSLLASSYAINNGVSIAGLTRDFSGNSLGTPPDIGILEYSTTPPPACTSFTYGAWSACSNNTQTRSYTGLPSGCTGTPDSILVRSCTTQVITGRKFYFSNTGDDSHSVTQAQNPSTPWKTLAKLNRLQGIAAAGDTFAFKRGEIFADGDQGVVPGIGDYRTVASVKWYGGDFEGYNFPSGTAANPIVFTNYGNSGLARPNLLYPFPTLVGIDSNQNRRGVLAFANVSHIVIDGLQFNDTRFAVNDKRSGAYTTLGLWFGDSGYCGEDEDCKCSNITVKNCNFSNIAYGMVCFINGAEITNNTFSNFKSTGARSDTLGVNDIGADPVICSGSKFRITNNRFTGSWAYANPNSSSTGLLGGALETINDFDSSFIAYNTFIDCSGGMEFGTNLDSNFRPIKGPNDDTICYNKFINCSNITYLNTTGKFRTQAKNLKYWNNFFVEGSKSRFTGRSADAGGDALGDGQTYATTGFRYSPPFPINKSTRYPPYILYRVPTLPNDTVELNFQSAWRPIGSGIHTQQVADTVFDIRNNIFWINNGLFAKYSQAERPKTFYRNNIYHLVDGYASPFDTGVGGNRFIPTSLGPNTSLATGEVIRNGQIIVDSASAYPQDWDMHVLDTSYAVGRGTSVGLTRDFEGNPVSGAPTIGIYQYTPTSQLAATSSSSTILCNGGSSTVTIGATGGTPPYSGTGTFSRAAGTYTFTVIDAASVTASTTVTITQPAVIASPTGTGAVRCSTGTVTISATGTGTIKWYSASTGGTLLSTGNSYTTPSISSTTIYYALDSINATGCKSARTAVTATVNALPPAPTGTNGTRCSTGTVTVSATGTGTIKWYSASTGGTLLATGNSYTTPSISATTLYYALDSSSVPGCKSARTAVTASIVSNPVAATASAASGCISAATTIAATPASGATIDWYTASTGGVLLRSGAASFDSTFATAGVRTLYALARVIGTTCVAPTRTAKTITINARPATLSGTGASLCGPGIATVSVTAGPGVTANWYSTSTATGSALQTGTLTGVNTYTTPSPISTTTSYWAFARNLTTGCISTAGRQITATVYSIPAAPAATSPISRCDTGKVTLRATALTGTTVAWYNVPTDGTILSTSTAYIPPSLTETPPFTTTYYVAAKLTTGGCFSTTRTPVVVNINPLPTPPTATSAERCGAGTVTLTATATTSGAVNDWFTTATGGTASPAGSNVLNATVTRTYYVGSRITATGCSSKIRTVAIARINTVLAAPGSLTGLVSICPIVGTATTATYTATAVTGAVLYKWTIPAGAVLDSGSSGLKIKVRFITARANDSIVVQSIGSNGCVGTAKRVLKLTTTSCATAFFLRPTEAIMVRRNFKKNLNSGK